MRKSIVLLGLILLASCAAPKVDASKKPLFEVLTSQSNGGGNIHFYEIVSDEKEMPMLLGDEHLRRKIKVEDIRTSNFLILNMGEKTSGGYSISVEKVEELADKIVVTVKEEQPDPGEMVTSVITYPYAIVKINSKKPIEVK